MSSSSFYRPGLALDHSINRCGWTGAEAVSLLVRFLRSNTWALVAASRAPTKALSTSRRGAPHGRHSSCPGAGEPEADLGAGSSPKGEERRLAPNSDDAWDESESVLE